MQYMKLNSDAREELMASLAGMKDYLRRAFQSLRSEEARAPGALLCSVDAADWLRAGNE